MKSEIEFESKSPSISEPEDKVKGVKVDRLCCDNGEGCEDCHFIESEPEYEVE